MRPYAFTTGHYFSGTTRAVVTIVSSGILFSLLISQSLLFLLAGPILLIVTLVVLFQQYFVAIDTERHMYYDGTIIFGIKSGSWAPYSALDVLYVKKHAYRQTMNSRGTSSTVRTTQYDGYLRFTDGEKIQLVNERSREAAVTRMTPIAKQMGLDLYYHDDLIFEGTAA